MQNKKIGAKNNNENMKPASKRSYESIEVGETHSFERIISEENVAAFAELTGDFNPLHVEKEFGERSKFGKNIVHGMLLGGLFSTLVGMHCPGEKCLYVSQSLNFRQPVFYGEKVLVKGTVLSKNDSIRMITLKTEVLRGKDTCVNGEAKAIVLE